VDHVSPTEPAAAPSRYDRIRRRLAPLALIIALAVLAWENCKPSERVTVTIGFELGPRAAEVSRLEVVLRRGATVIGHYRRGEGAGVPAQARLSLPRGAIELDIELDAAGRSARLTRRIDVGDAALVRVHLADDVP
jgi:hypothetical protein